MTCQEHPSPGRFGSDRRSRAPLINTPLQRGVSRRPEPGNRFNGFSHHGKTVETVPGPPPPVTTPLKRGVNDSPLPLRLVGYTIAVLALGPFLGTRGFAQSPVSVTLNAPPPGAVTVPADFVGLSFGMRALAPHAGGHFFSPTNQPLLTLFRNIGLRHLRLGGTSVEWPVNTPIPGPAEIDDLFALAKAAQVQKVIYTFRLLETSAGLHYDATNALLAKYIWDHYRPWVDSFALGNEPDHKKVYGAHELVATNFPGYLAKWQRFAAAISTAVPDARFSGPDACSGNVDWTTQFAHAQKHAALVKDITEHFYVGAAGRDVPAEKGIEDMLSTQWLSRNQRLYENMALPVLADGLPYRFTEANDHFSGGVTGASDTFAGALWALDFLHWWAAHGAQGVDFHNTQWVCNDVITHDSDGALQITPKGYGFKAFELGGYGTIVPLTLANPDALNLTAYAVRNDGGQFLTLINKEHGPTARAVRLSLPALALTAPAEVMFLSVANSDPAATSGITLGGDTIRNDAPWQGKWTSVPAPKSGHYQVNLPALSAAVIRLPAS